MTAAPTLSAAFLSAGLVAPDYGGHCLDAVLPAAASSLLRYRGAASVGADGRLPGGAPVRDPFDLPAAARVCVVLVDGLGHQMLTERSGHAPFLRSQLGHSQVLTAGFPSTTAASMGLFGTGRPAGRTGLAGYSVRNPETGGLANLVSWEGAGSPREWQREPSVFSGLAAAGAEVTSVGPARFAGSGLTEAALHGGRYVAAERLADRVDATIFELDAPGLVYLYWGEVDKVGHQSGWQSREWADELTAADRELGRLARGLPPGTLMLVTADHGMVDVDRRALVDVARTPALSAGVELVAGEPRATHVHTAPGQAEVVLQRWRETLGDAAVVASRAEALAAGWFGDTVADHVLPMIGDLVVAATGRAGVVDSRTQTPRSLQLRGMHGSFTPGEMLVPFLVVA